MLHPEREVILPPIQPAVLGLDREVRDLQAPVTDVAVGGGGRYLILHLPAQRQLVLFDTSEARVLRQLLVPEMNVRFAAGADKLLVALPGARQLQRWSLPALLLEATEPLPVAGEVTSLTMGSASNGPLLIYAKAAPGQPGATAATLVDVDTLQKLDLPPGAGSFPVDGAFVRVAADGTLFTLRQGVGSEPHRVNSLRLLASRVQGVESWGFSSSLLVPSGDGQAIYSGSCVANEGLQVQHPNPPPQDSPRAYLPAVDGPYYMRLDYKNWMGPLGGNLEFYVAGQRQSFARLADVEGVTHERINHGKLDDTLAHDQRVWFIPQAKLVVTIGQTGTQLVLRRFDPETALRQSGMDYLFIASRPTPSTRKGNFYNYQVVVKSSKGGVSYRLAFGPEGMSVAGDGRLTWAVPAGFALTEATASVVVRDATGRETFQTFAIAIRN
jgi:hypothetical protein